MDLFKKIFLIALLFIYSACKEVVDVELLSVPPVVVIDAWIIDRKGASYVKLSKSAPYNSVLAAPRILDAQVSIFDNPENIIVFKHQNSGIYVPENDDFEGFVNGNHYHLSVTVNKVIYTAHSRVPSITIIDSLSIFFRENDLLFADGYYLRVNYQDDPTTENYYMWKLSINNTPMTEQTVNLLNDDITNGQYLFQEIYGPLALGDTIDIEWLSLTKEGYQYYLGLYQLLEAGSPSQAIPENPVSNIEGALGFFTTASAQKKRIVVTE